MSSVDATAYDAFGRILASGGDRSYALGQARGYDSSRLDAIMIRRFAGDYAIAKPLLDDYTASMIGAAEGINARRDEGGGISMEDIPNNPFVDDDETGGNLFRWAADVTFYGASTPITVYGYSSSSDIEQIIAEAIIGGMGIADQYRSKFGLDDNQSIVEIATKLLYMQSTIPNGSTTN